MAAEKQYDYKSFHERLILKATLTTLKDLANLWFNKYIVKDTIE